MGYTLLALETRHAKSDHKINRPKWPPFKDKPKTESPISKKITVSARWEISRKNESASAAVSSERFGAAQCLAAIPVNNMDTIPDICITSARKNGRYIIIT